MKKLLALLILATVGYYAVKAYRKALSFDGLELDELGV